MKYTALHDWHLARNARMAPFAGYEMPIQYETGAIREHELTRQSAGLFDIDHMGQILVSGPGAAVWLSGMVSNRILDMADGQARYALLLNQQGGVIDDLFIYRLAAGSLEYGTSWFVVVNASNRERDLAWLREHLPAAGADHPAQVNLRDLSDNYAMIALQGPRAIELLERCGWVEDGALSTREHHANYPFADMARFSMARAVIFGKPCLVGRSGYTGEDGVEIFYPAQDVLQLWEGLLAAGTATADRSAIDIGPIGLAARDSLRFEAGMPLHGHELGPEITPLEAGFSWACDMQKDFIGRAALVAQKTAGLQRKLVTIAVQGGVPREGYAVLDAQGANVGQTVAGMFCPTTKHFACNAFVHPSQSALGTVLQVVIHGKPKPGTVVKRPLYIPAYRR